MSVDDSSGTSKLSDVLCLDDFEVRARKRLPTPIYHYIASGAERGRSVAANREAFERCEWLPRVLVDTSRRDTGAALFGDKWAAPFGIAPMGLSALWHFDGDLALAQGAQAGNVPMILSGSSLIPMEEVRAANADLWFQAYLASEDASIQALIERIGAAGFRRLVVTVDVPVIGNRENQIRAGFTVPLRPDLRMIADGIIHIDWVFRTMIRTLLRRGIPRFENAQAGRGEPIYSRSGTRDIGARMALSWENLALIRRLWSSELIVKGVLHPQDAARAKSEGADGVIVSNHGGRQLDGVASPLAALVEVRKAVGPEFPVMLDGGVRRGSDILLAIALGADFVFIGRPFAYACAAAGREGVMHCIRILISELTRNLSLLGVVSPFDVHIGHLQRTQADHASAGMRGHGRETPGERRKRIGARDRVDFSPGSGERRGA